MAKIVQALCYFLAKVKVANKLRLIKLLFLADKYHLIRYGRTITDDEYWAMPFGPVGEAAKDILTQDPDFLDKMVYKEVKASLIKIGNHTYRLGSPCNTNRLSDTDKEALDFIINNFGKMRERDLINYVHEYPEWKQYKELFRQKLTKREKIETVELLSTLKNDLLGMTADHIEQSRAILTGTCD
jgi:uncharacterized phage-associated protein